MNPRPLQKILYADDEQDIRDVAGLALGLVGGFTVCACASGAQALAEAPAFQPDLIVLDVMMPGMDGPATLAALRRNATFAETPVVFMTAKAQTRDVQQFLELGAAAVIPKPFQAMELAGQIRTIWDGIARPIQTPAS